MSDIKFLLKVSRPRFWLYILGPFLVGLAAATSNLFELQNWKTFVFGLFFLFPANLLIYGINDIFDYETDKINQKKSNYETLVEPKHRKRLLLYIILFNLPFIVITLIFVTNSAISLFGFLFFSIFYSAPLIRAKTKPILDSIFNILYVFPAIFAYKMFAGIYPTWQIIIGAGFWTMAMHAYSAIPDIEADRNANVNTVATFLGSNLTHIFCLLLYIASATLAYQYIGIISIVFGLIYAILMVISLLASKSESEKVFKVYKIFPLINISAGFILFWYIVLSRHFTMI